MKTDTTEAIAIVCIGREKPLEFNEAHKVVNLLRRGEKYEQMWENLLKNNGRLGLTDEIRDLPNLDLHVVMDSIKQEYFPEPLSKEEEE